MNDWNCERKRSSFVCFFAPVGPQMQNPAVEQIVRNNFYPLPPDLLQAGKTWYWRVLAMNSQADSSNAGGAVSDIRNFEVVTETPPAARPVLVVTPYLPIIYFSPNTSETIEANARLFAHIVSTINTHNEYTVTIEGHANYTSGAAPITPAMPLVISSIYVKSRSMSPLLNTL